MKISGRGLGESCCKRNGEKMTERSMDALAKQLDAKLRGWQPETADQVRQCIAEIIELADQNALDLLRSRLVEQEVLDMIDAPTTR
jgi:predicted NBD/HSP70 family sugar kinase